MIIKPYSNGLDLIRRNLYKNVRELAAELDKPYTNVTRWVSGVVPAEREERREIEEKLGFSEYFLFFLDGEKLLNSREAQEIFRMAAIGKCEASM